MYKLMQDQPLATLITLNAGQLTANHIPLHLDIQSGALGTLHGHVARANPLWQQHSHDLEVLAIFHGDERYITPAWYATKQETGKVVPTWNYVTVHAYGSLRVIHGPDWLYQQLEDLTQHNEATFEHQWSVADAPRDYIDNLLRAIVGLEIEITRLEGKWKVSQNQPERNQTSLINGLFNQSDLDSHAMAALIHEHRS